jgi:hypothetical protein
MAFLFLLLLGLNLQSLPVAEAAGVSAAQACFYASDTATTNDSAVLLQSSRPPRGGGGWADASPNFEPVATYAAPGRAELDAVLPGEGANHWRRRVTCFGDHGSDVSWSRTMHKPGNSAPVRLVVGGIDRFRYDRSSTSTTALEFVATNTTRGVFAADDLALGLDDSGRLRDFARANGVNYYNDVIEDLYPGMPFSSLTTAIDETIAAGGRIHFNLTGIKGVDDIVKASSDVGLGYTARELRYVCSNATVLAATTFHGGPAPC